MNPESFLKHINDALQFSRSNNFCFKCSTILATLLNLLLTMRTCAQRIAKVLNGIVRQRMSPQVINLCEFESTTCSFQTIALSNHAT